MTSKPHFTTTDLSALRVKINESIRVQLGGGATVRYLDPTSALIDIVSRQNHVIFARRGCGKSLLLKDGAAALPDSIRYVYLNCEDYKRHSFPNVLLEVLDSIFAEMERHFGGWFGKKKRAKKLMTSIRSEIASLRAQPDVRLANVSETESAEASSKASASLEAKMLDIGSEQTESTSRQLELQYQTQFSKVSKLDLLLPSLKAQIRDMFAASAKTTAIFILLDDFYFLSPRDQPFVMDYIHRLCKDTPLYFKIATLRHASTLYVESKGQPTGAQERHDYQPLNIEFGLADIKRTESFIKKIFQEYVQLAKIQLDVANDIFMGDGFSRLVLSGGGVPRDCLSLLLESLALPLERFPLGKDAVRELSRTNLERRIQELKSDAQLSEQPLLLQGIYTIRQFCLAKQVNSFVVEERTLQEDRQLKALFDRLLDYRLIHELGTAFTHKSRQGTFRGYIIDVGFYAGIRKLRGKVAELDLTQQDWRERVRSSPELAASELKKLWHDAPVDVESKLLASGGDDTDGDSDSMG